MQIKLFTVLFMYTFMRKIQLPNIQPQATTLLISCYIHKKQLYLHK
jgi:hypothetical protein